MVIVSIFVNPTQFGPNEDFDTIRADLTADAAMLAEYDIDYIFAPDTVGNYTSFFDLRLRRGTIRDA